MANALEAASLVMIPSGYEDGTLGSLKPTDGSGDFTFTRGSNLSATRVNEQGYIEKGYENLLTYSNDFSQWTKAATTATSGQSGYDGSSDAWLISKSNSNGVIYKTLSSISVGTISVYAKASASNWMAIYNGTSLMFFDLANGVLGGGSGEIDYKIEAVSGATGWYRCSVVDTSITSFSIYPAEGDGDRSGTSGSILLQDAMVNQGLVAYPYIETTTAPVAGGILEDMPRIDYSNGSCPALLLEPSRTNLVRQSEYANGNSKLGSPTITQNYDISPEGKQNAFLIEGDGSTYDGIYFKDQPITPNGTYTISIFVKKATSPLSAYGGFGFYYKGTSIRLSYIGFDEYNGAMVVYSDQTNSVVTKVEDYGDYYRFSASATDNGSNTLLSFTYYACISSSFVSLVYTGSHSYTAYGLQLEEGSYPTSYIPTYGVSQTRLADVCNGAGDASTFNDSEGVFYAEISTNTDNTDKALSINNSLSGGSNSRLWMGYSTTAKRVYALGYVNNSLQFALSKLMTDESVFVKIACKYALNDVSFFVNGEKVGTDTSALEFIGLNSLDFNIGTGTGGAVFFGNAKQVLYFPTALTDSECIELTTI